jgi:predicted MFS family arabinose efflux permease
MSAPEPGGPQLPLPTRVVAIAAGVVAVLVLNAMPALTGILAGHLGFSNADIGAFVSADVLGIACGSAASARLMRLVSLRALLGGGISLLALANLCSAAGYSVAAVTALRFGGGLGSGVALGACFYVFAHGGRERDFAAFNVGGTALAFFVIVAIPWIESLFGWPLVFVALGALALPVIASVGRIPAMRPTAAGTGSAGEGSRRQLRSTEWFALAGAVAFFLGQGSLYTFIERIGAASGFGEEAISHSLSLFALIGFVSCAAVLLLGSRVTGLRPLLVGVVANLAGALAVTSGDYRIYTAAICVFYVSLPIIATCQFAAIARADPSGRAAVYASTATFGGFAVGPYFGGILVERLGFVGVQALDIVMILVTAITLIPLLRHR